jgi:hypothetical protein
MIGMPTDRHDDEDRPPRAPEDPGSAVPGQEPEPEWAGEIRDLRRQRGDRLKQLFATFDEEEEGS